ncbi:MAG: WG repeat-containing protein [Clostridia bacterium]|nr:WG repeat-containing protein [Clostridia bacterium]
MNERIKRILARGVPLLAMAAICAAAMLYHFEYFDLSFIDRGGEAETRPPEELALESQLAGLRPGDTIGDVTPPAGTTVGRPVTDAPETTASPDALAYPTLDTLKAEGYAITYADWDGSMQLAKLDFAKLGYTPRGLLEAGRRVIYTLRTRQYEEDGERFPYEVATSTTRYAVELYGGYIMADIGNDMIALAESDGTLIGRYSAGDLVPAYTRDREGRPLFRTEETLIVDGQPVLSDPEDEESDPVTETVYYYLDATGALMRSDYDPELDGRGLNFDYTPDYGQSDNNLETYSASVTETLTNTIDRTNWYILGSIDADLAEPIYRVDPAYADKVASRNPAFKQALYQAIVKVKQEEREAAMAEAEAAETTAAETAAEAGLVMAVTADGSELLIIDALRGTLYERVLVPAEEAETIAAAIEMTVPTEETTAPAPETTVPAEESTIPAPETTVPAEESTTLAPETTAPVEETTVPVEETTAPPEETTAPPEETTAPPEETTAPPEETTAPPEETTAPPEETTAPSEETTAPIEEPAVPAIEIVEFEGGSAYLEGNNVVISREVTRNKWGFTYNTGWRLTYAGYLRTYAFREGRGAAVDTEGRLIFVGTNGYRALPTKAWANEWVYLTNENSRYVVASYVEPLFNDLSGIGHLYYDCGYVRVRELERDYSYRESVTADRELLIDTAGNAFEIPTGYTIAGYSDGVLLLERDGKYGYYSTAGRWIAQPVYTYAQPFLEGLGVIGFEGGLCGAVDTEGRVVIPFAYDYVSAPSSGVIACYDDDDGWTVLVKTVKTETPAQ